MGAWPEVASGLAHESSGTRSPGRRLPRLELSVANHWGMADSDRKPRPVRALPAIRVAHSPFDIVLVTHVGVGSALADLACHVFGTSIRPRIGCFEVAAETAPLRAVAGSLSGRGSKTPSGPGPQRPVRLDALEGRSRSRRWRGASARTDGLRSHCADGAGSREMLGRAPSD